MRITRWNRSAYSLTVASSWVLLAIIVFANAWGTFHTDIKPEVYIDPWRVLGQYLSSWTSGPYLGSPNFNVGLAPVLLVLSGLREIGLSPEITFKVFHLALWTLAAAGVMKFVRVLMPGVGQWTPWIAGAVYLANPYTVSAGSTLAIALPLALLPWMCLCLVRGLREPRSWAWPALFGLVFFAMSGMNVAVVPVLQLLIVIPIVIAMRRVESIAWLDIVTVVSRSALFVIGLSLYWLIPAIAATGTGSQIVEGSETLEGIAKVSSMTEVIRGLGLWPVYGSGDTGPWIPGQAPYVSAPLIMVLTMLWPVLGLLALRWATGLVRIVITLTTFGAAVIMVGVFPHPDRFVSPFAEIVQFVVELPVLSAFRTTNKIGALLALALAIGVAVTLVRVLPTLWRLQPLRVSVIVVLATMFAAWSLPAVSGKLYNSPFEVPDYWWQAANEIDQRDADGPVLVLPGQVRPNYRWTVDRPDDVLNSVMERRAVLPETTPNASPIGVNFLSALDGTFQSLTAPPDYVSTMARYLGAEEVLLRNDVAWEVNGGTRPGQLSPLLSADPGLFGYGNYGGEGQYTIAPDGNTAEFLLTPLQLFDVWTPRPALRATSTIGEVVVAGDAFGFAPMIKQGLLAGDPLVRYAQDLDSTEFAKALPQLGRLVITDTNQRREVVDNRLTAGHGPLLSESDPLGATRTLGDDPTHQTVKVARTVSVSTTQAGNVFFDLPYAAGEFAFDGDPATGWRFGDFRTGEGQSLTARFDRPTELGRIPVSQLDIGPVKIGEITLEAGGESQTVRLPDAGEAVVDLGGVVADELVLTVDTLRGDGFNAVGIAEIGVNDLEAEVFARTPNTFNHLYSSLETTGRTAFSRSPLDVLLTRVQHTPDRGDDAETNLRRIVSLPDERTFDATADVRVDGSTESLYDRIAGLSGSVAFTSSDFYFRAPGYRASSAQSANPDIGWRPGGATRDAWWQVDTDAREFSSVTLIQERAPQESAGHRVSQVEVSVDGEVVATSSIDFGTHTIDFEPVRGESLRVTLTGVDGNLDGPPPIFTTIDTGLTTEIPESTTNQCLPVATIDGRPIEMRLSAQTLAGIDNRGTEWVACNEFTLAAGQHVVEPVDGLVLDSFAWTDGQAATVAPTAAPTVEVKVDTDTRKQIQVSGATSTYAVTIGQAHNPNWRATVNGADLGPAVPLDGFSSGWIIDRADLVTIDIRYTPQVWSWIALGLSGIVALVAIALVALGLTSARRKTATEPARAPQPQASAETPDESGLEWPRWGTEFLFMVAAGFFLGLGGLGAAVALIALMRLRPIPPQGVLTIGLGLLMVSIGVYFYVLGGDLGEVSSDNVAKSLWPHHLASAGLVWAVTAGIWLQRSSERNEP